MKKMKLDADAAKARMTDEPTETAHGQILNRNDLLEILKRNRDQKDNQA